MINIEEIILRFSFTFVYYFLLIFEFLSTVNLIPVSNPLFYFI